MDLKQVRKKAISRIKTLLRKFTFFGHEKLTVMFVPHSQKKIFNFQISNFTIIFVFLLFAGIITVSVFAIKNYSSVREREEFLENENQNIVTRLKEFKSNVDPLNLSTEQIKESIQVLFQRIGALKGFVRTSYPVGGISIPIPNNVVKSTPGFKYDPLIVELAKITYISDKLGEEVQTIKNHLKHFKELSSNMPSVNPVFGGGYITSNYGPRMSPFTGAPEFHTGIDIAGMPGTPIRATADGVVVRSGFLGGFGLMVELKHKYGFSTIYSHCMRLSVTPGENVKKGQTIAYMGRTGSATGYHLHFEVRQDTNHVNPSPFMDFDQLN